MRGQGARHREIREGSSGVCKAQSPRSAQKEGDPGGWRGSSPLLPKARVGRTQAAVGAPGLLSPAPQLQPEPTTQVTPEQGRAQPSPWHFSSTQHPTRSPPPLSREGPPEHDRG